MNYARFDKGFSFKLFMIRETIKILELGFYNSIKITKSIMKHDREKESNQDQDTTQYCTTGNIEKNLKIYHPIEQ